MQISHILLILLTQWLDITLSGDGTTHKHINYESKHITLQTETADNEDVSNPIPSTHFAGIKTAPNHTSETQFEGWMALITQIFGVYKDSPLGEWAVVSVVDFASKIKGVSTDHAEDQKNLFQLIQEWKRVCEREQWWKRLRRPPR